MQAIALRETNPSCVGRDRELAWLHERFGEAARQGERLVLVRGPAGVGKTRLLAELRSRIRLDGGVVLEGRCAPGARALAPLGEILRRALRFLEDVGRSAEVDLAPVSFLLGDSPPIEPVAEGTSRLEQRAAFFEAYCSLLRGLSRIKPPVIIVHDLQWADPATLELLTHLLDGSGPWLHAPRNDRTLYGLVVASVRDSDGAEGVGRLSRHPRAEVLDLRGFDREGMSEFLRTPAVVEKLIRATDGNPERLEALIDSVGSSPTCTYRQRLDALSPEARRILAAMTVIGRPAEASLVTRVAGVGAAARALGELIDQGLVIKSVLEGEVMLRVARHQIGDLLYESLMADERRELHQRVVDCFRGAEGLAAQDVATHAMQAGDADTAVTSALEASVALELTFAYEAAAAILEDARPMVDGDRAVEIDRRLAELYRHIGEYDKALERAAAVLRAHPDDPAARLAVGRLRALAGDYGSALEALARVVEPAQQLDDPSLLAELATAQAEVHFRRGNYDKALEVCTRKLEGISPVDQLALENIRGKVELVRGNLDSARAIFEQNLDIARANLLVKEQAKALTNLGVVEIREHAHEKATVHLQEALELTRRISALRESAIALENLAVLAHFRRDYGAALECYHTAVANLKQIGNRAMLARAANNLGELYLQLADTRRAQTLADFARQMAGDDPPPAIVAEGKLLEARVAQKTGCGGRARQAFEEASRIFARLGEQTRVLEAEVAIARLDQACGDTGEAKRRLMLVMQSPGLDKIRRGEAAALETDIEKSTFGDPVRPSLVAIDCFEQAGDTERAWRAHLRTALLLRDSGDPEGFARHIRKAAELEAAITLSVPKEFLEGLASDPDRQLLRRELGTRGTDTAWVREPTTETNRAVQLASPERKNTWKAAGARPVVAEADRYLAERFPHIVWRSPAIRQVLEVVERAATTDSLVLIRGESGTGKELIADALHRLGRRSSKPLIKVNCGALVETLLLSELFGHEKGAFTGALQRRKGRFEAADGGTLFLDEIGDISPATQVSLLRVLQEQQFERVGGSLPITTDVRIICATNRDLEALVKEGRFREDLYYRLKGIQIHVPSLRERPEDIELLAGHFLERTTSSRTPAPLRLTPDAADLLRRHAWPGNVRELENVIRSVSLFVDGQEITAAHLAEFTGIGGREEVESAAAAAATTATATEPPRPRDTQPADPLEGMCRNVIDGAASLSNMKKRFERECIEMALDETQGNITRAAALLGMKRPRLSQLVKEHGLARHDLRDEP
jgi:transcriptional regulator with GAF, ATPase, and Fis domain/Flp pilus assembly protein TadD